MDKTNYTVIGMCKQHEISPTVLYAYSTQDTKKLFCWIVETFQTVSVANHKYCQQV